MPCHVGCCMDQTKFDMTMAWSVEEVLMAEDRVASRKQAARKGCMQGGTNHDTMDNKDSNVTGGCGAMAGQYRKPDTRRLRLVTL